MYIITLAKKLNIKFKYNYKKKIVILNIFSFFFIYQKDFL